MARRKINSVLAAFIEMAAVAWADGCDAVLVVQRALWEGVG